MNNSMLESSRRAGCLRAVMIITGFLSNQAGAQDSAVIRQFMGSWNGQGRLMGANAEFKMKWDLVLGDKFVHLIFQNKRSDGEGREFILDAEAFYKPLDGAKLEGHWFDSRGMILPLQASVSDSTLTTHWGAPETEQGRTVYRLVSPGHIEVTDFVLRKGEWRQFGNAVYRREND